jgi:hypothetical protein
VLERLVILDVVLPGELTQLVDRLGLKVGQVEAVLVRIGRERAGEDGRVLPGGIVVPPALAEPALVPAALAARGVVVRATARPTTLLLLLGPCVVVHAALACGRWFMYVLTSLSVSGMPGRSSLRGPLREGSGCGDGRCGG